MSSVLAGRVLAAMGPAVAGRAGALLEPFVDALTRPLADVDDLVQPGEREWAPVYDLDVSPFPGLLGQISGTAVPAGLTLDEQRAYVRDRASWRRGTPGAMIAAVKALLVGTQRVDLIERSTSAWRFTVRVYTAQLAPGIDAAALLAAVITQKPVGLIGSIDIRTGASFNHMRDNHGPTFNAYKAAFDTFNDARNHIPEEGTVA